MGEVGKKNWHCIGKMGRMGENGREMGQRGKGKMGLHKIIWGKWVKARELVEILDVEYKIP